MKKPTMPNLADNIDVRVKRKLGQRWEDISATTVPISGSQDPDKVARWFLSEDVIEVRWNWGNVPNGGTGQGHYIPGPAHPYYS